MGIGSFNRVEPASSNKKLLTEPQSIDTVAFHHKVNSVTSGEILVAKYDSLYHGGNGPPTLFENNDGK